MGGKVFFWFQRKGRKTRSLGVTRSSTNSLASQRMQHDDDPTGYSTNWGRTRQQGAQWIKGINSASTIGQGTLMQSALGVEERTDKIVDALHRRRQN